MPEYEPDLYEFAARWWAHQHKAVHVAIWLCLLCGWIGGSIAPTRCVAENGYVKVAQALVDTNIFCAREVKVLNGLSRAAELVVEAATSSAPGATGAFAGASTAAFVSGLVLRRRRRPLR